jgi:hypothetical protein
MKDLLPFVSNEVGFSVAESLEDEYNTKTWKKEYLHIKKVNPAVAEFISKWSSLSADRLHSAIMGILVYKLLENQAECDKMEKEFKF